MSSPQDKSTQNQPGVKPWSSVRQTITADHHLDPKRSDAEQAQRPGIWAPMTTPMKESTHDEETRPTRNESDREHDPSHR